MNLKTVHVALNAYDAEMPQDVHVGHIHIFQVCTPHYGLY